VRWWAGVAAAWLIAGGLATGASARTPLTIALLSTPGSLVRHAHPPGGDVADVLTSSLSLRADTAPHEKVGSMGYSLTMLTRTTARIDTTTTLPGGTIRASGAKISLAQPALTVTVTGGTGRFAGARGTLTFGPMTTQANVYRLTLP
jgi:hypothetical protein